MTSCKFLQRFEKPPEYMRTQLQNDIDLGKHLKKLIHEYDLACQEEYLLFNG